MNVMISVLEILIVIICAVTYGLMLYFKVKGNITEGVSELIALAEKTGLPGNEKMAQVVDAMYEKVPAWLKKILNKYELEKIAQWVFDWMRRYADSYKNEESTKAETDPEVIKSNLLRQLTSPVKWTQSVKNMIADGATSFTEVGPGAVLQGMIKKIDKEWCKEHEVKSASL